MVARAAGPRGVIEISRVIEDPRNRSPPRTEHRAAIPCRAQEKRRRVLSITHKFFDQMLESHRDSASKPRVGAKRERLPWVSRCFLTTPPRVATGSANTPKQTATHDGVVNSMGFSQGNSFLPTLGFEAQSRWDRDRSIPNLWVMLRALYSFSAPDGVGRIPAGVETPSGGIDFAIPVRC